MPDINLKAVISAEDRASATIKGFGNSLKQAEQGSKMFAGALIGVGAVLGGVIAKSTLTAARTETLGIAMNSVAKATGTSTAVLEEQEKILKQQGITTQEARGTLTMFMQSQLDVAQASKVARVAQDLAVIANVNSSEATKTLTNAIVSQEPMLLRQFGIVKNLPEIYEKYAQSVGKTAAQLTEGEKKQAFLNIILEEGTKVAGTYEAAMGTAGKQLTSLPRYFEEAANSIGVVFLPAFGKAIELLTEGLKKITPESMQKLFDYIRDNSPIIIGIIVGGLTPAFYGLATSIWAAMVPLLPFIAIGAAIGFVVKLLISHFGGWSAVVDKLRVVWETIQPVFQVIWEQLQALWNQVKTQLIPALQELWTQIGPILLPVLKWLGIIIGGIILAVIMAFVLALRVLVAVISTVVDWIGRSIQKFKDFWKTLRESAPVQGLINAFNLVVDAAKKVWTWLSKVDEKIRGFGGKAWGAVKGALGFQSGGIMPYEGLAYLHKGERVTPSEFVTNDNAVTVNFYGNINNTADKSLDDIGARIGRQISLSRQGAA
ncbi:MAG TPA: hypothetical protein VMV56_11925 [Williamwhitmania sp.]|nr:hypothetical protein [Williamwhitmania sp.]